MTRDLTLDAQTFFSDLESDNNKTFWHANKDRYDAAVRGPFAAILEALEPEWGPFKTFRMNRDVRFSADKTPYKTMHGAVSRNCPYRYLHIDKAGILLVAGAYIFTKDQLAATRERLANEASAQEFLSAMEELAKAGLSLDPGGAAPLKTAPRGMKNDHPMIEYLRWKGMMATKRISIRETISAGVVSEQVTDFWRLARPLTNWLEC